MSETPIAPLRVAHLLAPAPVGGLETVVLQLARGQKRQGHSVRVALVLSHQDEQHPLIVALRENEVPVDTLIISNRAYLRERSAVAALIRNHGIQVLHTHGYRPDVVDAGIARRMGRATVTTVHGFTGGGVRNRIYESLQVRAFRKFGAVVAVSRPLSELLERRGVPAPRLHVVPNAFESAGELLPFETARSALGLDAEGPVIGWVGRVSAEKGADVFIEALAHVRDRQWRVAILGDGPERARLEERANFLGLGGRVSWLGNVQGAARLYRAFDLFVLSSRTEGTPMALLEAMAAGVPVVATAVGGVPDIISEREGWIVPSQRPDLLAAAIASALESPEDARRRQLAANKRLATQLAFGPWLERYEEIYRSLI